MLICLALIHSPRAGGATAAANAGVPDRLFKRHDIWHSENAKDSYIKGNLEAKLKVSKNARVVSFWSYLTGFLLCDSTVVINPQWWHNKLSCIGMCACVGGIRCGGVLSGS